ncbi:protein kinase domain-containing protein [Rhodopirellula bahusiensis]|uniref:Adenylate/guanylate cyclase n=1 Tax=Rhodopirellula bahusiensis TaxID=2014065 RepID=A0A2G1W9Q0_9BACT|nr:protein kinase [Rhodopirellula bahusiensis]PHQ35757.1 adenylate/guanylate cyclase [Rhodopirellula bahusiensis]
MSLPSDKVAIPKQVSHYAIENRMAEGAFGVVYLGRNQRNNEQVAIKLVRLDPNADSHERFKDEAKLLAQLNHPGIVPFIDAGISGDFHYLVSTFVPGDTLEVWLKQNQLATARVVDIAIELTSALAHAHAHRIVHRDLKPQNIIMRDGRHPVIVDFDLAIHDLIGSTAKRRRGVVAGTPSFMSPEQVIGQGHRIDGRTDIYSLGVILYRMLTGHLPFRSSDAEELRQQIRQDDPQPPRQLAPAIPPMLEQVCLKAMAKDFPDRHATADDLASELACVRRELSNRRGRETHRDTSNTSEDSEWKATSGPPQSRMQRKRGRRIKRASMQRQITLLHLASDLFSSSDTQAILSLDEQSVMHEEFMQFCQDLVVKQQGRLVGRTDLGGLFSFGFPIAGEVCLRRGVRTALEFQDKFPELAERWQRMSGVTVLSKAVVHCDRAVVVSDGEYETENAFELNGHLRYVVAEMTRRALPRHVVVSDAARIGVKTYYETKPLDSIQLGKSEQFALHQVLGEGKTGSLDWAGLRGRLTPMIGRDDATSCLQERWRQTSSGEGSVTLVSGEPGIGKSRLIHWLCQWVDSRAGKPSDDSPREQRPIQLLIHSDPYYRQSSLHGVVACLRRSIGIDESVPAIKQLSKMVRYLDDLGIEGDQEVGLMASLLSISLAGCYPPLDLSPAAKKEATFELLRDWLNAYAKRSPVLLVLEDLHWADPSTLELLRRVIANGFPPSMMAVMTHRPEFKTDWGDHSGVSRMKLQRLDSVQMREMFAFCVGEEKANEHEASDWLQRTDGIPLFIEQIATIFESGSVLGSDAIPDRLQDLLLSRMQDGGRIPEAIQRGAAIGRSFDWDAIQAICDATDSELNFELDTLVRSELLFRDSRRDDSRFTFKHALIQDAAYETMIASQQQLTHGRIANHFLACQSPYPAEVIAHHFHRAHNWPQAVEHWLQAAQNATQAAAHLEAESHLGMALQALGHIEASVERDRKEIELRSLLGVHLQAIHGYAAAEVFTNYQRALILCEQLDDALATFPVAYGLFRYHVLQSQLSQASNLAETLLRTARETQDIAMLLMAHRAIGTTDAYRGRLDSARQHLEAILEVQPTIELRNEISKTDVVDVWVTARAYLAWTLWLQGDSKQALVQSDQAIAQGEPLTHPVSLILPVGFSQWLHQLRGDVDRTEATCNRSDQLGREYGFPFWNAWTLAIRGWVQSARGDHEGAIQTIQDGVTQWRASGTTAGCHYFYTLLAESCLKNHDSGAASEALNQAQAFADKTDERFYEAEILRLRGEVALLYDPADNHGAALWFRKSIELAERQGATALLAKTRRSLHRIHSFNSITE